MTDLTPEQIAAACRGADKMIALGEAVIEAANDLKEQLGCDDQPGASPPPDADVMPLFDDQSDTDELPPPDPLKDKLPKR
jgi:hypothetical protein